MCKPMAVAYQFERPQKLTQCSAIVEEDGVGDFCVGAIRDG